MIATSFSKPGGVPQQVSTGVGVKLLRMQLHRSFRSCSSRGVSVAVVNSWAYGCDLAQSVCRVLPGPSPIPCTPSQCGISLLSSLVRAGSVVLLLISRMNGLYPNLEIESKSRLQNIAVYSQWCRFVGLADSSKIHRRSIL